MRLTEDELQVILHKPGYTVVGEAHTGTHQIADTLRANLSDLTVARPTTRVTPQNAPRTSGEALNEGSTSLLEMAPRYRSKTEARFAEVLRWRVACGEITAWWHEPFSLRLGVRCHYLPDFLVCDAADSALALYEVKGAYIRDRALVKVRAAATRYPCFRFLIAQWHRQQWRFSEVRAHG